MLFYLAPSSGEPLFLAGLNMAGALIPRLFPTGTELLTHQLLHVHAAHGHRHGQGAEHLSRLPSLAAGGGADGPAPGEPLPGAFSSGEALPPVLRPLRLGTGRAQAHNSPPLLPRATVS
jgi:hypothetical protein